MGGWMDGWMEGRKDGRAGLRIAYSNQKFCGPKAKTENTVWSNKCRAPLQTIFVSWGTAEGSYFM